MHFSYRAGYFGCLDELEATKAALKEFMILARCAWDCLPVEVRARLVVEPFLDPSQASDEAKSWALALYALTWTSPHFGMTAERWLFAETSKSKSVQISVEPVMPLLRQVRSMHGHRAPTMVPTSANRVAEWKTVFARREYGTLAKNDLKDPGSRFTAFLKPDVFQASVLAIDRILAEFRGKSSVAVVDKSVLKPPLKPTRRVSLAVAAKSWFGMHKRTLQNALSERTYKARQISPKLWEFDLSEVPPRARADADPTTPRRARRAKSPKR